MYFLEEGSSWIRLSTGPVTLTPPSSLYLSVGQSYGTKVAFKEQHNSRSLDKM